MTKDNEHEAEPDYVDLTGKIIAGRYLIKRVLGAGGMGVVYAAVDQRLDKPVAIKVLKEDFAHRKDVVARFTLEAKSAARIKHENVLDVTDYGETEDQSFYIAMELLDGEDLNRVVQKGGPVEPLRAVGLAIQITRALSVAHQKGVVHRDLKPENVFLVKGDDGREIVKIVDFGIAQMKDLSSDSAGGDSGGRKLTRTGMIFGTPEYMSPEQAAGKTIDHRVDIYATGVILYEMLAGRPPFLGDNFMGVLTLHMFEALPPIAQFAPAVVLPVGLEAVVRRALAKAADDRYATMDEMGLDLQRIREGLVPTALGASTGKVAAHRPDVTGLMPSASHTGQMPAVVAPAPVRTNTVAAVAAQRTGLLVAAGLTLVVVLGLVGMRLVGGNGSSVARGVTPLGGNPVNPLAGRAAVDAAVAAVAQPDASAQVVVAAAEDAGSAGTSPGAASAPVHLLVASSEPARVVVEGDPSLQCERTPCDLRVTVGRQLRLVATAGARRGEMQVTVERDGQGVTIPMAVPHVVSAGPHTGGGRPNPGAGASAASAGGHSTRCVNDHGNWHQWNASMGIWIPCSPP